METTIRILQCREPSEADSRVLFTDNPIPVVVDSKRSDNPSRFIVICERFHKVPIDINRYALHQQFTDSVIEWQGEVSVELSRTVLGLYTVTTTNTDDIIARMLRLWRPAISARYWYHPDVTPKAMVKHCDGIQENALYSFRCSNHYNTISVAANQRHLYNCVDQRVWQISKSLGLMTQHACRGPSGSTEGHTHVDTKEFDMMITQAEYWHPIPSPDKAITGWKFNDVTCVHDPYYGAYLSSPPMGLSFTQLDDDEPPTFDEAISAPTSVDKPTTSASVSTSVSTVDRLRQRVDELESREAMLSAYIDNLAERLNPRLTASNRIKSSRELVAT